MCEVNSSTTSLVVSSQVQVLSQPMVLFFSTSASHSTNDFKEFPMVHQRQQGASLESKRLIFMKSF